MIIELNEFHLDNQTFRFNENGFIQKYRYWGTNFHFGRYGHCWSVEWFENSPKLVETIEAGTKEKNLNFGNIGIYTLAWYAPFTGL